MSQTMILLLFIAVMIVLAIAAASIVSIGG
jgi:hypothetical protein